MIVCFQDLQQSTMFSPDSDVNASIIGHKLSLLIQNFSYKHIGTDITTQPENLQDLLFKLFQTNSFQLALVSGIFVPILSVIKKNVYLCNEILGKSHYLFIVWFLFDKLTFYSSWEYKDKQGFEVCQILVLNVTQILNHSSKPASCNTRFCKA